MSEPTVVCVLGMHRSGTSLLTRMLHVLGLDLGPEEHLMGPSEANPTGHWESLPISEINDEILERQGGSWWEPPVFEPGWARSAELAEPRQRAREVIATDFADSKLWGFKDPRTCLTAPLWQHIVGPMRYLICLRNPVDVAKSLQARKTEPIPFDEGAELWLTYVRASFAATAGHQRKIVFYEDLMADPEPIVAELARFLGHRSESVEAEARAAIRLAASAGLWHHRTTLPNVIDASRLPFHVKALYMALRQFVPGAESVGTEALDILGAYAAGHGRRVAELEMDRVDLRDEREWSRELERELADLERELADHERELADYERGFEQELAGRDAELEKLTQSIAEERRVSAGLEAELREPEDPGDAGARKASERSAAPGRPPWYDRHVSEVRDLARELIAPGATVLVASKGDDALLELKGSRAWHFPLAPDGRYLGHHPAGDTAAIAQLEALRAQGADHLLLPSSTLWWLDHYEGLRRHLENRYVTLREDESCAIYQLSDARNGNAGPIATLKGAVASFRMSTGRDPSILEWRTELGIGERLPELPVFTPPEDGPTLPYLDGTVDIVVTTADPARIAEAHRVGASAVVSVDPAFPDRARLEWLREDCDGWGKEVGVTLIPDSDAPGWDATLGALIEARGDGFAGRIGVVGDRAMLESLGARATAATVPALRTEVDDGASLARRASAGIEAGDGQIQIFITSPAVLLPDWLPSILALFSGEREAGVVGTRIISPYGQLEEAGGVVGPGGSRQRLGEGEPNPDRPEFCFVRRVDFCSPPLLATRRDLFERLAGFDEQQASPRDALVDFSLRAGRSGAPVYYQPQARVVAIGERGR